MKLSVALCSFNGEKYIEKQLNSILNQTNQIDEIIVCDDGSNDGTISILKHYQDKYPNIITCYKNESNLKSNKNFEKAISLCTGDYIFLSDQDDIWEQNKVESIMNVFEDSPKLEGVFSNAKLINAKGEKYAEDSLWDNILFVEGILEKPVDLYKYITEIRNIVTGGTLCIKSSTRNFLLPFPNQKDIFHDEWIALNLSFRKTLSYTTEKLICYRVHSSQQIGVMKSSKKKENLEVIKSILNINGTKKYKILYQIYKSHFRNYIKFKRLHSNYKQIINFDLKQIIEINKLNIIESEKKMKKSNFLFYSVNKIIDKITGKRQIHV